MAVSDITILKNGIREWYLDGPLERLRMILPEAPPMGSSPLLSGQYWKLTHPLKSYGLQINDVIRIDGLYCDKVVITRYKRTATNHRVAHCAIQIHVPIHFLFQAEQALRCSLLHVADDQYSVQLQRLQPSPKWASIDIPAPPLWIQWVTTKLQSLPQSYIARPYTDGSWDSLADINGYFRPSFSSTKSSAAIIIKDDTCHWKSLPVIAIYIKDGPALECESVYSMEFLALAGALQMTVFNLEKLHATASDAQGVLKLLPNRRQHLQKVLHDHHFLLQCIDNSLFKGAPMPYHVRGHAERRKPQKDVNGLLGQHWNKDDWGNWIADRIAAQDQDIITQHGIHIIEFTITASELYSSLPYVGQWYIGHRNGHPVNPNGVSTHLQHCLWSTYLAERDDHRRKRGVNPKWVEDSSMRHSSSIYDLQGSSLSLTSTKVRIIYDKGYHGGNRAKDDTLSTIDRLRTQSCILCGSPDSQDHWLHRCSHPTLAKLRTSTMVDLNKKLTDYREQGLLHRQIGAAFKHLLFTTDEPARIWTANWSQAQINNFCTFIPAMHLKGMKMKDLGSIIQPLEEILAHGALGLWRCKQVHERLLQVKPRSSVPKKPTPKRSRESTTAQPPAMTRSLPHRRLAITPILTTSSPTLVTSLAFPILLPNQIKKLSSAQQIKKTSTVISNIDNVYHIAGAMIQRLCGNEYGEYYDSGRLHATIIHGFLRILQRCHEQVIRVASSDTWDLILSGTYDKASRMLFGRTRRPASTDADWIFILPQDRRDCNDTFWCLIGIDMVRREIHYHKLHAAYKDDLPLHLNAIYRFLQYMDLKEPKITAPSWTQLPHVTSDCINTDCGVWICLLVQVLLHHLPTTVITVASIHTARPYIAMCLLEQNLPNFSKFLIRRVGMESTLGTEFNSTPYDTHVSGIYYPRNEELQGYIHSYNLLHDRYFYDPYVDDDPVHTDYHLHPVGSSELIIPAIPENSKLQMRDACLQINASHRYFFTAITDDLGVPIHDIGCVEGRDFHDLIQPEMISSNLLDYIFYSQYPTRQTLVTYINSEVANAVLHCNLNFDYFSSPEVLCGPLYGPLTHTLNIIFNAPTMVFGFCHGEHITGVIVHAECSVHMYTITDIVFLDSMKGEGQGIIDAVVAFLRWLSVQKSITLDISRCHYFRQPTECMIRQRRFRPSGSHPYTGTQIDCGI